MKPHLAPEPNGPMSGTFCLPRSLKAGSVILEKYRLEERIGEGGMGEVWRVENLPLEKEVALKLIKPEYARNENGWQRFEREAKLMAKIQHPNVVDVYDLGTRPVAGLHRDGIRARAEPGEVPR